MKRLGYTGEEDSAFFVEITMDAPENAMKDQTTLKSMSKENRYLVQNFFVSYFAMGVYLILIGSELPVIQEEYGLSYRVSGMMLSVQSVGYLVAGAFVSILPQYFSVKKVYLVLANLAFIGLALMTATDQPLLLLFAMLMTGISKGSTGNFGNRIVSTLSGNSASLLNLIQAFFAIGACIAPLISVACGASWRVSFWITIGIGLISLLYSLRIHIGADAYVQEKSKKQDLSFFKTSIFWICSLVFLCYLSIEASVMGWTVTYILDSGMADETTAQIVATALWVALLIGRFASTWLARYFQPYQMLAVMTAGVTVSFSLFIAGNSLFAIAIGAMGLGLFMAGMYGTALAGTGDLVDRYPLCMGMFIMIPGIGAAIIPNEIGILSDQIGIRGGMCVLYILIVLLIVATAMFVHNQKNKKVRKRKEFV